MVKGIANEDTKLIKGPDSRLLDLHNVCMVPFSGGGSCLISWPKGGLVPNEVKLPPHSKAMLYHRCVMDCIADQVKIL